MRWLAIAMSLTVLGCGDDGAASPDGGGCLVDEDCGDGVFCSGIERCVAGACAMGNLPCPPPLLCDEAADRCQSPGCDTARDADADGHEAIPCGGDDCDDADPDRFPGNPELCDSVDQDCDPTTLGDTDADGDGFVSRSCCDGERCGADCDDGAAAVGPTGTETCDGVDDDCDGDIDEGVLRGFYPDLDHDNFGDRDGTPMLACARMEGIADNALDCDDGNATINPTGLERCNGVDDNCNGMIDDPDATALSCTATFGSPPSTFFACVDASCLVQECSAGFGDCNGEPSDGCETDLRTDLTSCGTCGNFCGVGGTCIAGSCDSVADVSAGADYTCVARSPSGQVVCWGSNSWGQLGDFSTSTRETPVVVGPVLDARNVETERFRNATYGCPYTCAQTMDLVYCWGCNRYGQMGDGDPEERSLMPEPANGVPPVIDGPEPLLPGLSVGGGHACSRKGAGASPAATLCWGGNDSSQVDGSPCLDDVCETTAAAGLPGGAADQVAAGYRHTCFLVGTTAYCVGSNTEGQLGDGTRTGATAPVLVQGGHAFVMLAAGYESTCGVRSDGAVLCWGANGSGQLGDGSFTRRLAPTRVSGIANATDVAIARATACAVLDDDTARCWGEGSLGQLGDGMQTSSATPVSVGLADIVQISCGADHTCALDGAGDVWCWGGNGAFQVGPATLGAAVASPTRVSAI